MSYKFESNLSSYTRIFILCGKFIPSHELQAAFESFGTITDFKYLKDKSGNPKGITYITYSKPSEAARAIDEMNGAVLPGSDRSIKVILASERSEGNVRDPDENSKMRRLFIVVPSQYENKLEEYFTQFGEVISVKILPPNKGKTLGFITFRSSYCAAKAVEECDPSFKAIFAQTKSQQMDKGRDRYQDEGRFDGRPPRNNIRDRNSHGFERGPPPPNLNRRPMYEAAQEVTLFASMVPGLEGRMVSNLFNLAPGMLSCHYNVTSGEAILKYSSMEEGAFVIERFSNFQYPPNCQISVYSNEINNEVAPNIQNLVKTIEKATNLLQQAGLMNNNNPVMGGGSHGPKGRGAPPMNFGIDLPPRQPMLPETEPLEERLFIVTSPGQLPLEVLEDLFCRFGNLLSYNYIGNKTYGYVRYASSESAHMAIEALHKKVIMGTYLKVILADPPANEEFGGKRKSTFDDQIQGSKYSKFD